MKKEINRLSDRSGHAWHKIRVRILRRDSGLCQPCKAQDRLTIATQVDHVIALVNGGTDDEANLQAICGSCHDLKTRQDKGLRPSGACDVNGYPLDPRSHWNK